MASPCPARALGPRLPYKLPTGNDEQSGGGPSACRPRGWFMNAVELHGVTKTFAGHTAVADLSLAVPTGCIYGFIGPNGSGKTTTLRMIMRILHPDEGTITVLGENRSTAANDRIGYLPEERGLYKQM